MYVEISFMGVVSGLRLLINCLKAVIGVPTKFLMGNLCSNLVERGEKISYSHLKLYIDHANLEIWAN